MRLPKSLIKKYGITKKAWRIHKGKKSHSVKAKSLKKRGVKKVGKKKRYHKKAQQTKSFIPAGIMRPLASFAYGAGRGKINQMVRNSPIAKIIPASNYSDEVGALLLMWGARKLGAAKNPILGSAIRAGEAIEWAGIGEQFATNGGFSSIFGGSTGGSNTGGFQSF